MKQSSLTSLGPSWLCLTAAAFLIQGCAGGKVPPEWNGIFAIDAAGGAKTCVAPSVSPPDGKAVLAQVQTSNEGGWCGITVARAGVAYDSYLLIARPGHGRVFAHRVGGFTRIDYTPDTGFAGTDHFSVRLIPGDAVVEETVTVTR